MPKLERQIGSFTMQYPLWQAGRRWEYNLLFALEELGDHTPRAARDLGRVLGRALDIAGDVGTLSFARIETLPGPHGGLVNCEEGVNKPGCGYGVVTGRGRLNRSR